MKKAWLRPGLFALGGVIAGLVYHYVFGCANGCPITADPVMTAVYMGITGLLLSEVFRPKKK